jgi:hypothetical protein
MFNKFMAVAVLTLGLLTSCKEEEKVVVPVDVASHTSVSPDTVAESTDTVVESTDVSSEVSTTTDTVGAVEVK